MEIFYLGIPTEPTYLLPTLPFLLILIGLSFKEKRNILLVFFALIFLSNFVRVNIARTDVADYATGASFGVWVEPGYLVQDAQKRFEYMSCGNQPCGWIGFEPE